MSVTERVHERAEARIAELMGIINLATAELTTVIAEVLATEAWNVPGIRSAEAWVGWQCGVSPRRARQLVKIAARAGELPCATKLFGAGQLSEDTMGAIARRTPVERDEEVADLAPALLYNQLRRWLRSLPTPQPDPEPEPDPDGVDEKREVSFGTDGDRWKLRADLPVDEGALVEKALARCRSEVFHERFPDRDDDQPSRAGVSWADGLLRTAERALQAMDGTTDGRRPGDRNQLLFHIDVRNPTTLARLHLGDVLPDPIRRYLACDADVRAAIEADGVLAALSERYQTVSPRLRAVIEHRDGGCVVPGCGQKRWLHIHHLRHWEDGGPTESWNLCCLCPYHHRLHHRGMLAIDGDPNQPGCLVFRDHRGRLIGPNPPAPPDHPPPTPDTPYLHPTGEHVDWPYVYWRNLDAVSPTTARCRG